MTEQSCLLVDIGNTLIKWGVGLHDELLPGAPFASVDADFSQAWDELPTPATVWVSNVAGPAVAGNLRDWLIRRWGLNAHFARSELQAYGVVNGYDEPARLGVDRWVALIGARRRDHGALCVADCGTAITVDVLNEAGEHLGGVIAPGLALMNDALSKGTHGLWHIAPQADFALGRETSAAISAGLLAAAAGVIERTRVEATRLLGRSPHLILTGGDGAALAGVLSGPLDHAPDLILEGLYAMALETK